MVVRADGPASKHRGSQNPYAWGWNRACTRGRTTRTKHPHLSAATTNPPPRLSLSLWCHHVPHLKTLCLCARTNLLVEAQQHPILREHGELLAAAAAAPASAVAVRRWGVHRQHDEVGLFFGWSKVCPLGDERGHASGAGEAARVTTAALRPSAFPGAGACFGVMWGGGEVSRKPDDGAGVPATAAARRVAKSSSFCGDDKSRRNSQRRASASSAGKRATATMADGNGGDGGTEQHRRRQQKQNK